MKWELLGPLRPLVRRIATWRQQGRTLFERLTPGPWRLEASVSDMDDVPAHIRPRRAYLVATATHHKWLVFDCPCGTGHRIVLNLDRARRPTWAVRLCKRGALTLHPSVDYRDDRLACHYVLWNGRVEWVRAPSAPTPNEGNEGWPAHV